MRLSLDLTPPLALGDPADPPVVLLGGCGWGPAGQETVANRLAAGRRYVLRLDLETAPVAGARADQAQALADRLRQVLSGLPGRPVVVAGSSVAAAVILAMGEKSHAIAAGLVLIDDGETEGAEPWAGELRTRLDSAISALEGPTLIVQTRKRTIDRPFRDCEIRFFRDGGAADFADLLTDFLDRRAPRSVIAFEDGADPRQLRKVLGCFSTGVTVVTTMDGERPVGLTANSFTSVSLEPPLILVSLARTSASLPAFERADAFAVNVLHAGQQQKANLFATRVEDRFSSVAWEPGGLGAPVLHDTLAVLECERYAAHDGGDHRLLIGRVVRAAFGPARDPLIFFRGQYRGLQFASAAS